VSAGRALAGEAGCGPRQRRGSPEAAARARKGRASRGAPVNPWSNHAAAPPPAGPCRDIPQIEDPRARVTACSSSRACVRAFPCQARAEGGRAWAGGKSSSRATRAPCPQRTLLPPARQRSAASRAPPPQVKAGLLWVWADSTTPPPPEAQPAVAPELGKEGWTLLGGDWFARDLEYG
jgi:hypothetical protein